MSPVLRKLSLKAEKNWHQNSGANRRDNIKGCDMASSPAEQVSERAFLTVIS
jgi:hypothetical protein